MRLRLWHAVVLLVQLGFGIGIYYLTLLIGGLFMTDGRALQVVAQSMMLCFIVPTATAAPIIAARLGGSIQGLTTFTMLSNLAVAIVVPLFFPIVNPAADIPFWTACLLILRKVGVLLMGPFFAAWLLRIVYEHYWRRKGQVKELTIGPRLSQMPFYLWVGTVLILTGDLTNTLIHDNYSWWTLLAVSVLAIASCVFQYWFGWKIGERFPAPDGTTYMTRVTAGQALGQKNNTLAIWMAQTYLLPLVDLGAALYMIAQNLFNSWELSHCEIKE